MKYSPLLRVPFDLSSDEMAEILKALCRANAEGTVVNRVVSCQLEERVASALGSMPADAGVGPVVGWSKP